MRFQKVKSDHAAVKFEGHHRGGHVFGCGSDVVEEAGKEIRFDDGGGEPGWEGVVED